MGRVNTSSIGSLTTSQAVNVAGLPFAAVSGAGHNEVWPASSIGGGLNITAGHACVVSMNNGNTYGTILVWDAATGTTSMTVAEFSANGDIEFSGGYDIS